MPLLQEMDGSVVGKLLTCLHLSTCLSALLDQGLSEDKAYLGDFIKGQAMQFNEREEEEKSQIILRL